VERFLNKITCGDNCDLMGELPRECIDLVVTSPPYDDLRAYGGHSWDFYGVAWQLKRVLKPGGVIVWVVNDATKDGSETGSSMEQALHFRRLGLNLHDTMIWEKSGAGACGSNLAYLQNFEFSFVISKGRPSKFNPIRDRKNEVVGMKATTAGRIDGGTGTKRIVERAEMGTRFNIWRITQEMSKDHPAPFPLQLAKDHILSWSNAGDIVLDPFSGSGTTAKAAKELGRQYIGFEINPDYCTIADERTAQEVLPLR
jgi:DNA modification methylase